MKNIYIKARSASFRIIRKLSHKANLLVRSEEVDSEPLGFNLDFEKIISVLNDANISGLHISNPKNTMARKTIAVLDSDKYKLLNSLYDFSEKENIELKFRTKRETSKLTNPIFIKDLLCGRKNLDIRLYSNRTEIPNFDRIWIRLEFWQEFDSYYSAPCNNFFARKLWKTTASQYGIFNNTKLVDYSDIIKFPHEKAFTLKVDLVYTWVNSDDKDWQHIYKQYKPDFDSDATSTSRFLSRDELKFSLRSWDKFGEFINKIYIVSNCKPPAWLNLEHDKIKWVYHEDIIPENDLPTFSSHAIETSLHKIPGLSNYFIYSNDDLFLTKKATATDFFLPNGIAKLRLENYGNVNGSIDHEHPDYLNAARNCNVLLEDDFGKTCTQLHTHSPQSMRVDLLNEMNEKYKKDFERTRANKFRKIDDLAVASYLSPHYSYLSGNAIQSNSKTYLIQQNHNFRSKLDRLVRWNKNGSHKHLPLSVCLNDGADSHLNDEWNESILNFLNEFYPEKSSFEK